MRTTDLNAAVSYTSTMYSFLLLPRTLTLSNMALTLAQAKTLTPEQQERVLKLSKAG